MTLLTYWLAAVELALSPATVDVKWNGSQVLIVQQVRGGHVVEVRDRAGKLLRETAPTGRMKRGRFYDAAISTSGLLAISMASPGTLGPAESRLLLYLPDDSMAEIDLGPLNCHQIAIDGDAGFWCLGSQSGKADAPVLHWVSRDGAKRESYIPRMSFPAEGPAPYDPGDIGPAQLIAIGPGQVLAWLPAGDFLAEVNRTTGAIDRRSFKVLRAGRSIVSLAASEKRFCAMLPVRQPGEIEGLLTRYRPTCNSAEFPRGSVLVGMDPGGTTVAVWSRQDSKVYFLPSR